MRILALDYGDKHTGVALGENNTVLELTPIHTTSLQYLILQIENLIAKEQVEALLVGIPNHINAKQKIKTEKFIDYLKSKIVLPVYTVDESGTSKESFSEMFTKHSDIKKIKNKIHSSSASKILERLWMTEGN